MRDKARLTQLLETVLAEMGLTWPEKATVEPPQDPGFGDLAINVAMMLAKEAKRPPRDIAADIKAELERREPGLTVDIAGPGFLNVTFPPAFWAAVLEVIRQEGEGYGHLDVGRGRRVLVEYVSANPTGPLHIGHGRGAAVGDSLRRILRFAGFQVGTEYYVNDAGRQMRLLGASVWTRLLQDPDMGGRDIPFLEDGYKGDYIVDLAREVFAANPGITDLPEDEALAICQEYAEGKIRAGIKRDLAAFGCEHELWFSEKTLVEGGQVAATIAALTSKGLAWEEDGAVWCRTTRFGDDKDRVLKKSDGYYTYFASDIAYHRDKFERGFDLCVDVWGADHHGYIPRMKAAVQTLGREAEDLRVILVQLVNLLRDGTPVAMSTRAGQFETLEDVVTEVGVDASRFMFLSRKSDSSLDFDLELVKQKTMDNPVYYVQYAHARIHSVFRKAAELGVTAPAPAPALLEKLDTPEDLALLKALERFTDTVAAAAERMAPHLVCHYLSDLAQSLHRHYAAHRILDFPDTEVRDARLALLDGVRRVLANGLNLLGVSAPEQM